MNPALGQSALLELNGASTTLNGLSSSGAGTSVVDNNTTTAVTLTIGTGNASSAFYGNIQNSNTGAVALTKTGTGTFTLGGVASYNNLTTVQNGTLRLGANDVLPGRCWQVGCG